MDAVEALKLCRYVDAKAACKQITAAQPFVTIAEVLKIVKQIRAKRIADAGDLTPPTGITDAQERAWLGEARRQIGDGLEVRPDHGELRQRYLPELRALMPKPEETQ